MQLRWLNIFHKLHIPRPALFSLSTWSRYSRPIIMPTLYSKHSINLQGKTKGLQTKAHVSSRHAAKAAANTKKGQRHIAPKKAALVKQATMKQVSLFPIIYVEPLIYA